MTTGKIEDIYSQEDLDRLNELVEEIGRQRVTTTATNSLTPDDRLFLAYLAAVIAGYEGAQSQKVAEDICRNYREQEK